jgi:hypothetical protein
MSRFRGGFEAVCGVSPAMPETILAVGMLAPDEAQRLGRLSLPISLLAGNPFFPEKPS